MGLRASAAECKEKKVKTFQLASTLFQFKLLHAVPAKLESAIGARHLSASAVLNHVASASRALLRVVRVLTFSPLRHRNRVFVVLELPLLVHRAGHFLVLCRVPSKKESQKNSGLSLRKKRNNVLFAA